MKDLFLIAQARQLAEEATDDTMGNAVRMLIKQFLAMNMKDFKPVPELAVKHFVGKHEKEYSIDGICMDIDNKVAVATSRHVLLVNPDEFKSVAGVKNGVVVVDVDDRSKKISNKFPPYAKIIPDPKSTKPIALRPMQDILFEAKHSLVEASFDDCTPIVKIADKTSKQCDIYIAVARLPFLMLGGADGWTACMDGQDILQNPIVKRYGDSKVMMIMTAKPVE